MFVNCNADGPVSDTGISRAHQEKEDSLSMPPPRANLRNRRALLGK